MRFYTKELSGGSLTISQTDGAMTLSVQANDSSVCTITGNFPFQGVSSSAITLSNGEGLTISANAPNSPIDGITITVSSGTVDVIIGF